jgi:resuscitation-promoting factor RpfA
VIPRLAAVGILTVYLVALAFAVKAAAKLPVDRLAFWDRIAQCETGGNWRMHGPVYSGGVGFYNGTWSWWARELGLARRYPFADWAPRLVQIRVAEYGYTRHNGFWGCDR